MSTVSLANDSSGGLDKKSDFDNLYEYFGEIGKGRYASVKKCVCKKTQKVYAAKVIKNFRVKNTKLNMNIVDNEIMALTISRQHPSIINLYEVFYNRCETILLLEYATEKDLYIYLDKEGAFEEEAACRITYQILKAIEFLHSKQVLHLDIKPENVLLMSPLAPKATPPTSPNGLENNLSANESGQITDTNRNNEQYKDVLVKLCDFSFSQIMVPGKPILGMMGTVAYSAPEVLQYDALTKATDMWSLGVLTYVILTGFSPFTDGTEEINKIQTSILNVREKEFECTEDDFDDVSAEAKNFIENLIKFKPKQRLNIEQALNHSWFKKYNVNPTDDLETTQPELEIAPEDDKENFTQEKTNPKMNNSNNMKLLSEKNLTKKTNPNLSRQLKDDKNNNNLLSESSSEKIQVSESTTTTITTIDNKTTKHLISNYTSHTRKTSTSGLDTLIDVTSFTTISTSETKNVEIIENIESNN